MLSYDEVKEMECGNSKISCLDFCDVIAKDLGIIDNPKAVRMIEIAFQHSENYWQLYTHCKELVELIK